LFVDFLKNLIQNLTLFVMFLKTHSSCSLVCLYPRFHLWKYSGLVDIYGSHQLLSLKINDQAASYMTAIKYSFLT